MLASCLQRYRSQLLEYETRAPSLREGCPRSRWPIGRPSLRCPGKRNLANIWVVIFFQRWKLRFLAGLHRRDNSRRDDKYQLSLLVSKARAPKKRAQDRYVTQKWELGQVFENSAVEQTTDHQTLALSHFHSVYSSSHPKTRNPLNRDGLINFTHLRKDS